jgi:hypothetical protein
MFLQMVQPIFELGHLGPQPAVFLSDRVVRFARVCHSHDRSARAFGVPRTWLVLD